MLIGDSDIGHCRLIYNYWYISEIQWNHVPFCHTIMIVVESSLHSVIYIASRIRSWCLGLNLTTLTFIIYDQINQSINQSISYNQYWIKDIWKLRFWFVLWQKRWSRGRGLSCYSVVSSSISVVGQLCSTFLKDTPNRHYRRALSYTMTISWGIIHAFRRMNSEQLH